jgi:DNA-binding NtrC family response regulator
MSLKANYGALEHHREVVERDVIQRALASHGYSRANAARALGISRVTLYKKIKKYGLEVSPSTPAATERLLRGSGAG